MGFFRTGGNSNALRGKSVQKPTVTENGKVLAYNSSTDEFVWVKPEMTAGAATVVMDSATNGRILVDGTEIIVYDDSKKENKITKSTITPISPALNDLWIDTSVSPKGLKFYNGTSWESIGTTVVDSTVNGNIKVNGQEIIVFDDSVLRADVGNLKTDVTSLKGNQHSHSNKSILDRLGINASGHLTIDGIEQIGSGGNGILTYQTLADLQTAYPNGYSQPVWIISEKSWHYWEGESVPVDTTAPNNVTNLTSSNLTATSVTLNWTASNSSDIASYDIYRGGTFITNVSATTYNATGLSNSTQYTFSVRAKDESGNVATGTDVTITTSTPADTTPPNSVTNLTVSNLGETTLTLNWTVSTSSDIASYDIYRGATFLANVSGVTYGVTGLNRSTQYTFSVRAKDNSGNVTSGTDITISTTADVTAPNNVTNLTTSNLSTASVTLNWNASTSPDVTGYNIYNGVTLVTNTASTSYTVTGLTSAIQYTFYVKAKDGANNVASGTSVTVTTVTMDTTTFLYLNGVSDYLKIPSLTFDKVVMDASYAPNPQDVTSSMRYIDFRSQNDGYVIRNNNGKDVFNSTVISSVKADSVSVTSNTTFIPYNKKVLLEVTMNGVKTGDATMFASYDNLEFMRGSIYDIKFYNGATVVAHYDMSTGTVNDQSGNGKHATLTGGKWEAINPIENITNGFVTFIDDDARKGVYTDLLPLFNSRNAKFNIAVATGFIDGLTTAQGMTNTDVLGVDNYATWEQLREIKDQGHGIISHSVHHKSHMNLTLAQELAEFADSKARLQAEGFNPKVYAFPYCEVSTSNSTRVLDYYESAFRCAPSQLISHPMTGTQKATMARTGIGSWGADLTSDQIKAYCLQAKNEGKWYSIMTHIDHINDNPWTKASSLAIITDVLDYCVANSIEVISIDEAMSRMSLYPDATDTTPDVTAPTLFMTPAGLKFIDTKRITMSANETSTIYYTLDGTTPTTASLVYSTPITLNATTTVNAFAVDSVGNSSAIQTVTYTKWVSNVLIELDAANHGTDPNVWQDLSGSGKHVTLYNFTHDGTTNGWTANGLLLNGVDNYLRNSSLLPFNTSMQGKNFVIEFDFCALDRGADYNGKSTYYLGLMKEVSPYCGLKLGKTTTATVDLQLNLGTAYTSSAIALTANPTDTTIDKVIIENIDGVLKYYLNGTVIKTVNVPSYTQIVDQPLYIGANIISGTVQRFAKIRVNRFKFNIIS